MRNLTRRQFGKTVAAAAALAGTGLPELSFGQPGTADSSSRRRFPEGFVWGCATAAYQIEGGANDGGRGQTNWDVFSHTPGKTHDGDTGAVADDSYHRYKEDIQTLKGLGCKSFRLSVAWSRVFPEGTGQP